LAAKRTVHAANALGFRLNGSLGIPKWRDRGPSTPTEGWWCCPEGTSCRQALARSSKLHPSLRIHRNLCSQLGTAEPELVPTHTRKRIDRSLQLMVSLQAARRKHNLQHSAKMLSAPTGRSFCNVHLLLGGCELGVVRCCSQCSQLGTAELELAPTHTMKHIHHLQLQLQVCLALHNPRSQLHTVEKHSGPTCTRRSKHLCCGCSAEGWKLQVLRWMHP